MITRRKMRSTSLPIEHQAHRQRLLEGMARSVAAKGYAGSTVSDIVREAGVSRRTFYEHFPDRADCLIALYEAASLVALKVLRSALDPKRSWQTQVEQALQAYLECLASDPVLLRTLYVEILGLGGSGLEARRRVNQDIADFMLTVINVDPSRVLLSPDMAVAVVGGVNELILLAIEKNNIHRIPAIAATAAALIRTVVEGSAAGQ
jgi:AcrR family transcriptional regulator